MILDILKQYKWQLAVIYPLLIIQYVLMSLVPLWLGKAIDGLMQNDYKNLTILLAIDISALAIGTFLKRYDTRVFMKIFSEKAAKVVEMLTSKNTNPNKITNRYGLVGYYTDFFEFSLPQIIQASIGTATSLIILFYADYRIGIICGLLFILMCFCNLVNSYRTQKIDLDIQNLKEEITQKIMDRESSFGSIFNLGRKYIRKSDIDATNFFCVDSLSIIMHTSTMLLLVYTCPTIGVVTSTLMYADDIYAQSHKIFYFLMFMRGIENTNKLINED